MPTTGDTALEHLPQDFHDLVRVQLCQKNERVNVMGVVVDWKEPSQTRNGTDLFATYNLQDPTSYDPKSTYEGLAVRLFWPDEKSFPKVKSAGDVLILRGVHISVWGGRVMLSGSKNTRHVVIPGGAIQGLQNCSGILLGNEQLDHLRDSKGTPASTEEQYYACHMRAWTLENPDMLRKKQTISDVPAAVQRSGSHSRPSANITTKPEKFSLLSNVKGDTFYEVVAEVAKVFPTQLGKDVYITDYTYNDEFYNYEDPATIVSDTAHLHLDPSITRNWPGPHGKIVLQVTVYPPHTQIDIQFSDIVYIRNLRVTWGRNNAFLEGRIHEDKLRPDQCDIEKIDLKRSNQRLKDLANQLRSRKAKYYEDLNRSNQSDSADVQIPRKERKRKQKKKQKQAEKRARLEAEERVQAQGRAQAAEAAQVTTGAESSSTPLPIRTLSLDSNPRVRCGEPAQPLTPLLDIINKDLTVESNGKREVPFIDAKYRCFVRVVDFYPPNLEAFAQSLDNSTYNNVPGQYPPKKAGKWEWSFWLLVEDATVPATKPSELLQLYIGQEQAVYLLKLDAVDLRQDQKRRSELQERLWTIGGDVAELKEKLQKYDPFVQRPANLPFVCCIEEYGAKQTQPGGDVAFKRTHRMALTTIM